MIKLEISLPERYRLVSIHWRPKPGAWMVCVCIERPQQVIGDFYGMGEHSDVAEAARLAVAKSERLQAEPPPMPAAKYVDSYDKKSKSEELDVDLSDMKFKI